MRVRTSLPILSLALVGALVAGAAGTSGAAAPQREATARKTRAQTKAEKKAAKAAAAAYEKQVAPLLKKYCVNCHGPKQEIGGINVTAFKDEAAVVKARDIWEKIAENVGAGHMPPKNSPQPSQAERTAIVGWIEAKLSQVDCEIREPGAVTLRRLNRVEYNHTVRDLVGIDFNPAEDFPSDDVGYGFDNIGDVLSISPLLMEKYLDAAEQIVQKAIVAPETGAKVERIEVEDLANGDIFQNVYVMLGKTGDATQRRFPLVKPGEHLIRIRAFGQQWGPEPPKLELRVNNQVVTVFDVTTEEGNPGIYQAKVKLPEGRHLVKATYLNNYNTLDDPDPKKRGDRNLVVDYLEMVGPLKQHPQGLPESHRRIFTLQPEPGKEREAARKILAAFTRRAYRRPVATAELDRILKVYDASAKEGLSFELSVGTALQAVLTSPHFLFRVELDGNSEGVDPHRLLNGWELANRLSYFLWSSMPDEELFSLAESGELRKPEVLEAQARRMLKDPKAFAFVENFGGQWLTLRNLKIAAPDPQRFPTFNEALRADMEKETLLFFQSIMQEDRSLLDLFDANYTFLNERLAKHYGLDWVKGDHFRKVVLADGQRGGILKQASVLTITSNPTRTNPVKRGKWILEQILGTPPPPPPPDVPELADDQGKMLTGTLRQRLEQHREDPGCASCHNRLDPLGFALENYDAVGAWRVKDGEEVVDASGVLPSGEKFQGPTDFQKILLGKKKQIIRNLSERMLTYAIGRGVEHEDRCYVDEIAANVSQDRYRFSALVTSIVTSDPFRKQKIDRPEIVPQDKGKEVKGRKKAE